MTKRILFNSMKGGVGKTTLSTVLARFLSGMGKTVLMIDFDPQAHATLAFNHPKKAGLYNTLARDEDMIDNVVVVEKDAYILPGGDDKGGGLLLLPGNKETQGIVTHALDPNLLADKINEFLEDVYEAHGIEIDYIIYDTAPTIGLLLTLPYFASDAACIPTEMENWSLAGMRETITVMRRQGIPIAGVVPTMVGHNNLHEFNYKQVEAFCQQNRVPLLPRIYDRIAWAEAAQLGVAIYDENARGKAAREAVNFCSSLMQQVVRAHEQAS
jgi:cellulose biosynthesis protein BcsQ